MLEFKGMTLEQKEAYMAGPQVRTVRLEACPALLCAPLGLGGSPGALLYLVHQLA
jgi:hypothetical protein